MSALVTLLLLGAAIAFFIGGCLASELVAILAAGQSQWLWRERPLTIFPPLELALLDVVRRQLPDRFG